jgi:hypothetical protein
VARDPPPAGAPRRRRRGPRRPPAAPPMPPPMPPLPVPPPLPPPPKTHRGLVRRFEATIGLPCELIGSGLFFDTSDCDLVVRVEEEEEGEENTTTLAAAYERVRGRTGFRPDYLEVTGERVAVLVGEFEGVAVDVQVWRGERGATTPAEAQTRRALALAARMRTHLDPTGRRRVQALHGWFAAAGLKGARRCRLPGVAVTVLAIVLGSKRAPTAPPEALLEELRALLLLRRRTDAVVVDLDELAVRTIAEGEEAEAEAALRVLVDEVDVAAKLTAATTRHLLHALTFSTSAAADFAAWRRASMVPALRVRAREAGLTPPVRRLDGHPLLDGLHLEEEGGERIVVWVSLRAAADASAYGFRDGDRVEVVGDDDVVTVRRGRAAWPLLLCQLAAAAVPWAARRRVTDRLVVDGGDRVVVVPNAPTLSVDVAAAFDPKRWEVVW